MSWIYAWNWVAPLLVAGLGTVAGYTIHWFLARNRLAREAEEVRQALKRAREEAETILRDARLAAREATVKAIESFEQEHAARRRHLTFAEERLAAQQTDLDRRAAMIEKKTDILDRREEELRNLEAAARSELQRLEARLAEVDRQIAAAAALPPEEARRLLFERLEQALEAERAAVLRRHQEDLARTMEARAREVILGALERYAADQVNHASTCTITLPDEEMKGRIIGREGRNIRSLEMETGCTFIIDDTPRTLVISTFDPLRREIARRIIEALIADGRIHPARIEETAVRVRSEVDDIVRRAGQAAVEELEIDGIAPELLPLIGTLQFRTSFSQNVLRHSIEMGHLMGLMAPHVGLDPAIARRVGLLHDIGKALTHKVEGPHASVGADLLRRHGEPAAVWEAVAAHHHEMPTTNPYAALASAADAMSAARPGARSEATEMYLRRVARLEQVAGAFPGVRQCYAVHAGREVRVFVVPEQIGDDAAIILARDIARKVRADLPVIGQLKVTVIRETRCVEYVH